MAEDKPLLGYEPGPESPLPLDEERIIQLRRFAIRRIDEHPIWSYGMGQLLEHIDHLQAQLDAVNAASIDFFGED